MIHCIQETKTEMAQNPFFKSIRIGSAQIYMRTYRQRPQAGHLESSSSYLEPTSQHIVMRNQVNTWRIRSCLHSTTSFQELIAILVRAINSNTDCAVITNHKTQAIAYRCLKTQALESRRSNWKKANHITVKNTLSILLLPNKIKVLREKRRVKKVQKDLVWMVWVKEVNNEIVFIKYNNL